MNYLAHAYLSFEHPEVLAGNMISDHVKGKTQYDYSAGIQAGIRLHRAIDEFTDLHPVTKEMMHIFRPQYRLYAGAFVDIVYDYCLANDPSEFKDDGELYRFSQKTYASLQPYLDIFPFKFQAMFPHMVTHNWLYHYKGEDGMQKSFNGLAYRATYLQESKIAFELFINNKEFFKQQYAQFFPSVKKFAADTMRVLLEP
ncbi:MAG: DUF479 domain-containing protein [Gloeobacteraceae cyanobacterium ES-bin-316]|nr:DUF479 domain-containing protein [Ferruginibacter sp.]